MTPLKMLPNPSLQLRAMCSEYEFRLSNLILAGCALPFNSSYSTRDDEVVSTNTDENL